MTAVVLGGGIAGLLVAYFLDRAGVKVSVVDPRPESACSRVAAGLLAPGSESDSCGKLVVKLGERSLELWPEILATLDTPVFFERRGTWVVGAEPELEWLARRARRNGITVAKREDGLHFPNEGQIEPRDLLPALSRRFFSAPGNTDWVIDCRGADALLPGLRSVRGEIVRVRAPRVKLPGVVRFRHPRTPIYVAPRPDDVFVLGATSLESDDTGGAHAQGVVDLLSAAIELHPGFAEAEVLDCAAGRRPAFRHHEPRIFVGRGYIAMNGLYRHGFLVGPAVAEVVMRIVLNGEKREVAEDATLQDVLKENELVQPWLAIAVNQTFVPRARHASTPLAEGDAIEALTPQQGG